MHANPDPTFSTRFKRFRYEDGRWFLPLHLKPPARSGVLVNLLISHGLTLYLQNRRQVGGREVAIPAATWTKAELGGGWRFSRQLLRNWSNWGGRGPHNRFWQISANRRPALASPALPLAGDTQRLVSYFPARNARRRVVVPVTGTRGRLGSCQMCLLPTQHQHQILSFVCTDVQKCLSEVFLSWCMNRKYLIFEIIWYLFSFVSWWNDSQMTCTYFQHSIFKSQLSNLNHPKLNSKPIQPSSFYFISSAKTSSSSSALAYLQHLIFLNETNSKMSIISKYFNIG